MDWLDGPGDMGNHIDFCRYATFQKSFTIKLTRNEDPLELIQRRRPIIWNTVSLPRHIGEKTCVSLCPKPIQVLDRGRNIEKNGVVTDGTFVPGHFEVTSSQGLRRFHDYLAALRDQVSRLIEAGASLDRVRAGIQMEDYADFRQYPQWRATFADNAEVLYRELRGK